AGPQGGDVPFRLEPDVVPGAGPAPLADLPPEPSREAERGARRDARARRRGGKGAVIAFLLMSALPIAGAAWWFTRSAADRKAVLEKIPSGVATRATAAGVAFALLLVLALVVLPGARAVL